MVLEKIEVWLLVPKLFGYILLTFLHGAEPYLHCNITTNKYAAMNVIILPALADNYMYLIIDKETKKTAIVDPFDSQLVADVVKDNDLILTTILTTHHHGDHAGSNHDLINILRGKNLTVVGGDKRINSLTKLVKDNDEFKIGDLNVKCLHTPCHTDNHICYYVTSPEEDKAVFTGDTLFAFGCGGFYEGTPEMMYDALVNKLGSLPNETKVYCGHDVTENNLKFASFVEPNNTAIQEKLFSVQNTRVNKDPTVPSTIGEEKILNPYMRTHESYLQNYAKSKDPIEVLGYLRAQHDHFEVF